ncbi:hypothetical protein K9N68_34265 (plasmid) [Kovacikia minuta CCNUW1]|uniref:hypothetical protein n=1 Tax=Kovacikia minuta TaxID=2931930 RepID=UPI001CCA5CFA|nr:hypothetical protein [Kovacikia minuta]UBF30283.1 hypothetical protein K9N68_34265 [Kovacikia minuta CCNUW1]
MQLKVGILAISILGLLTLEACGSNQPTNPANSPTPSQVAEPSPTASVSPAANSATNAETGEKHGHGGQGGQVVETGKYHLELVTLKQAEGTHLDFYLQQGDNHAAIPNAKVTAQVQRPDGSQTSLEMKYDAAGKHYYTVLPTTVAGEYKVAILSEIRGEKVNARYRFKH